jgi:hypothetical protein
MARAGVGWMLGGAPLSVIAIAKTDFAIAIGGGGVMRVS